MPPLGDSVQRPWVRDEKGQLHKLGVYEDVENLT